jgi:hypothetical protein
LNPDDYSINFMLGGALQPYLDTILNVVACAFAIWLLLWGWVIHLAHKDIQKLDKRVGDLEYKRRHDE